ncbi:MAG: outer membrane lipoprotein-sorting protein [Deltaproteobacteria bacterium]|nr:outer membrane lipoprotein-sorting protein [Deltaproteobacteria bacterium]
MRRFCFFICVFLVSSLTLNAETAQDVLKKIEARQNEAMDAEIQVRITTIEKNGTKKVREGVIYQKGEDKRVFKFTSPADIKGLSVLSTGKDTKYIYLPEFKKVRRIAGHIKNQSFGGTDFTNDEISSTRYSDDYEAVELREGPDTKVITLKKREGSDREYDKIVAEVTSDYVIKRAEMYKNNKVIKVLDVTNINKHGKYIIGEKMIMRDLTKNRSTEMEMIKIEFDKGLSDEIFSERFLKK